MKVIKSAAFEACDDLDPATVVFGYSGWTVRNLVEQLSKDLGRPVDRVSAAEAGRDAELVAQVEGMFHAAASGDEVQSLLIAARASYAEGEKSGALDLFEQAARLGDVEAMHLAAGMAMELNRRTTARFWAEGAAAAGSARGMYQVGDLERMSGNVADAKEWYAKAGAAGEGGAYGALIDLAEQDGDTASAMRWAAAGARIEDPFCLFKHGLYISRTDPNRVNDVTALWEKAGQLGSGVAMVNLGIFYHSNGNPVQARFWLEKAEAAGHPMASTKRRELGL